MAPAGYCYCKSRGSCRGETPRPPHRPPPYHHHTSARVCGRSLAPGVSLSVKIGINGFGRIGRNFFRAALAKGSDLEIVAVNDLDSPAALAHLLKYDTVGGRLDATIEVDGDSIIVNGKSFKVLAERNPA